MSKTQLVIFTLSASAILLSALLVFFSLPQLPSEIPLWYTKRWGPERLARPDDLKIIPTAGLLVLALNAGLSFYLRKRREELLSLSLALLTFTTSLLFLASAWRIVNLVGPAVKIRPEHARLLPPLLAGLFLSLILTPLAIRLGKKFRLVDRPHGPYTKVRPLVRLGGIVLFLSFFIPALLLTSYNKNLLALILGGAILIVAGVVDDYKHLPPQVLGVVHLLAAAVLIWGGLNIEYVRNPFGQWVGGGLIYFPPLVGSAFTLLWVFSFTNIVNWLDGLDGLATGIGVIAALTLFAISLKFRTPLPTTLSLILSGALLGFLPFNFPPAKIILGGGAYLLGFLLAGLSIYSAGRTATALLVLSVPALDTMIVVINRIREGKPPHIGDKTHLHHRLLERGLSVRQTVLVEWGLVLVMGIIALFLTGFGKLVAIVVVLFGGLLFNELAARGRLPREESG
jgi:UDP-GlcNAc:undecaprenyl-phosphate GlcNAc-1-phosphate transferase